MHRGPHILYIVDKPLASIHGVLLNVAFHLWLEPLFFALLSPSLNAWSGRRPCEEASHMLRLPTAITIIPRLCDKFAFGRM